MIKRKILMLGAFSVGKTSLVSRFVSSVFSEKYLTTVGVKVDKKEIPVGSGTMDLLIWDIQGQDSVQEINPGYFRGAAGYLLVMDGTRKETLDVARDIHRRAVSLVGDVPFVALLNKADVEDEWTVGAGALSDLASQGWRVLKTSARTGLGVDEAFSALARQMLPRTANDSDAAADGC